MVNQFDQHELGDLFVGESVEDSSPTLFDEAYSALDFGYVFFCRRGIHHDVRDEGPQWLEFIVHQDGADLETSARIKVHDTLDPLGKILGGTGGQVFSGDHI